MTKALILFYLFTVSIWITNAQKTNTKSGSIEITSKPNGIRVQEPTLLIDFIKTDKTLTIVDVLPKTYEFIFSSDTNSFTKEIEVKPNFTTHFHVNMDTKAIEAIKFIPIESKVIYNQIYLVVNNMPEFSSGEAAMYKYIGTNIEYPEEARQKGFKGGSLLLSL